MAKIKAPKMVYVSGEEMTRYGMELILKHWIEPNLDISDWQFFDLSCKNRDVTQDKVLADIIDAGKKIKSIFKEPTITPTEEQKKEMGLSKAWGSPNGAMRKGWNGISISRDTIHLKGIELGYKRKVLFDRHAVGGEYSAGFKMVGKGEVKTIFYPENGGEPILINERKLKDNLSAAVFYDNPLDNVYQLADHFFSRSLAEKVTPYVVTKKTVFKWQEDFWRIMKEVFDTKYKQKFLDANLLPKKELEHMISDNATMQIIKWTQGGFSMVAHNYDGDMLTDEISQVHKSPGFISSNLIGVSDNGEMIKEFEASHGTVSDMYHRHLRGEETSLNPLGMVYALIEAMKHSEILQNGKAGEIHKFCDKLYDIICDLMATGKGTRDLCGKDGATTEGFVKLVAEKL
jgi:isocitrate dehydrogenase